MSWLRRRWWLVLLFAVAVAALVRWLRDPYSPVELERNKRLAGACNLEALDYLGDYYEKRGDEGKLHEILERQRQCRGAVR